MKSWKVFTKYLFNLWEMMTGPSTRILDLEERSQAKLLSSLLLAMIFLGVLGILIPYFFHLNVSAGFFATLKGFILTSLVLYCVSRTIYFHIVKIIVFVFLTFLPLISIEASQDFSAENVRGVIIWPIIAFILASALLTFSQAVVLVAANAAAMLLILVLFPEAETRIGVSNFGFVLTLGGLVLVQMRYRSRLEVSRRSELIAANSELALLRDSLETRVTERTKALNDLEEQYRALAEHNPLGVIRFDRQFRCLYVNPAAASTFNFPVEHMAGSTLRELLGDRPDVGHLEQLLKKVFETGKPLKIETDVEGCYESWWLAPELDDRGNLVSVLRISMDVTENRRSEEALRASEERFRAMNDASPFGVFVNDPSGNRIYYNPMYLELLGVTEAEVGTTSWQDVIHPDDRGHILETRNYALSNPPYRFESVHRFLRKGNVIWVNSRITSMWDGGRLVGFLGLIEDITDRIDQINARISSEETLRHRTDELEVAIQELEGFSYTVSHDLRAPLRAIDGYSRILQKEYSPQLPSEANRYIETIRANAQRMGSLIDDLLAFSRLGRQTINREPINMTNIVQAALETFREECAGRKIEFTINELPDCLGDPVLLQQVWVNLLSNAIKFTGNKSHARVEIGSLTNEMGEIVYFTRDNGAGFDMVYADKLFGVFQRLHRQDEFEGTGVGLAIVQRIIQRHGGRIWAKSFPGKGATFYFTIGSDSE
jgi:PAS domain S-box-containing protein